MGDGDPGTPGRMSAGLIGLKDMYATFSEILDVPLPDLRAGAKGAEDSLSVLSAWRGKKLPPRPAFFNDHKESRDGAASAIRLDNPTVGGKEFPGQWKLFLDAGLIREGQAFIIR